MLRTPSRTVASLVLLSAAACTLPTATQAPASGAPELAGFGTIALPFASPVPAAQRWYVQGVLQAYAFNEVEAVRMFKAALAEDPRCAMCAWGVAWQLGPNINDLGRGRVPEALPYLDIALRNAGASTPRDRALIDAMALRYAHASQTAATAPLVAERCGTPAGEDRPDPLDQAYADRLHDLVRAAPDDPELLALWAEAEMIATRDDWWPAAGPPAGRIGELTAALERGVEARPGHIGLNHYLIHATDAPGVASRARAAADRLGALAPASPHLLHMPSHTYVRLGRYADAASVNQAAVAADVALAEQQRTQGYSVSKDWRNHDQQFLWYAALMQGRGDEALRAARELGERASASTSAFGDYRRSLPTLALLRLRRWDALIAEPMPIDRQGLAQAIGEGAHGAAYARLGHVREAKAALQRADAGATRLNREHSSQSGVDRMLRDMASAATDRLRAEIAAAEGRHDAAIGYQADALAASRRADDNEPPMLAAGDRLALGDLQLRAGRPALAEQTFRDDLAAHPGSGWALDGLTRTLRAEGRTAEAEALAPRLEEAWAMADAGLRGAGR